MITIGTQTFGLSKELTSDFSGTIKKLHDIGFTCIEPLILFQEEQKNTAKHLWTYELLKEAKPLLDSYGIQIPSVHVGAGIGFFTMPANRVIENLIRLNEEMGIDTFVFSGIFHSKIVAKKWGRLVNTVAKEMCPRGCTIAYHNHDDEFTLLNVNGQTMSAMDYFLEIAGEDILLQLDIGWAALSGNEYAIVQKYANRIVSLHYKDFYREGLTGQYSRAKMPANAFAPIGEGVVKSEAIYRICHKLPHFNGTILIDQDKYTGNMLDSLRTGYQNLLSYKEEALHE